MLKKMNKKPKRPKNRNRKINVSIMVVNTIIVTAETHKTEIIIKIRIN